MKMMRSLAFIVMLLSLLVTNAAAREYSPTTGRYIQPDPMGLEPGWNRINYANLNPLLFTDPLGLWSIDVGGFWGPGMNFNLGYDPGLQQGFLSMQFGYGVGGGVMYSPGGGLPAGQGALASVETIKRSWICSERQALVVWG